MKVYWLKSLDNKPHGYFHWKYNELVCGDVPGSIEILLPNNKKTLEAYIILLHEIAHYYQHLNQEKPQYFTKDYFKLELNAWRIAKAMIKPEYYDLLDIMAYARLINYSYECCVNLKRPLKIMPLHYRIRK